MQPKEYRQSGMLSDETRKFEERRRFLRLLSLGGVLVGTGGISAILAACTIETPRPIIPSPIPPTPSTESSMYASGEELTVDITLTGKDGRQTNFKEKALEFPREKIVAVRNNLEVVNKSNANPILLLSPLEQVANECEIDILPFPIRMFFIDQVITVPGERFKKIKHVEGATYFGEGADRIVTLISLPAIMSTVVTGRIQRGDDPRRIEGARLAADLAYNLTRVVAHELYHAGKKHVLLDDPAFEEQYDAIEEETRKYGEKISERAQMKEIPPLVVAQQLPSYIPR